MKQNQQNNIGQRKRRWIAPSGNEGRELGEVIVGKWGQRVGRRNRREMRVGIETVGILMGKMVSGVGGLNGNRDLSKWVRKQMREQQEREQASEWGSSKRGSKQVSKWVRKQMREQREREQPREEVRGWNSVAKWGKVTLFLWCLFKNGYLYAIYLLRK